MSVLSLFHDGAVLAGASGVFYAAGVASVAAASVLAGCPERRQDARETIKKLIRRRSAR